MNLATLRLRRQRVVIVPMDIKNSVLHIKMLEIFYSKWKQSLNVNETERETEIVDSYALSIQFRGILRIQKSQHNKLQ